MATERRAPRRSAALAMLAEKFEAQNQSSASSSTGNPSRIVQRVRTYDFGVLVALERAKDNASDIANFSKAIQQSKDAGVPLNKVQLCEELLAREVARRLESAIQRRDVAELELVVGVASDLSHGISTSSRDLPAAKQLLLELKGPEMLDERTSTLAAEHAVSNRQETSLNSASACSDLRHNARDDAALLLQSPPTNARMSVVSSHRSEPLAEGGRHSYVPRKVKTYEYRDILDLEGARQGAQDVESLQKAIERAKELGLPSGKIKACEELVAKAERDKASIQVAVEKEDIQSLESAILSSSNLLRGQRELIHAQKVLNDLATCYLEAAVASQNIMIIEHALGKCAGVLSGQETLLNARTVVQNLRIDRGLSELKAAVEGKDIATLESALILHSPLLSEHPMHATAQGVLRELKIARAVNQLTRYILSENITLIEAAIVTHRDLLSTGCPELLADAQALLARLKLRRCMTQVSDGMRNQYLGRSMIPSLRENIQAGLEHAIGIELIESARDLLEKAESCQLSHWCGVCLDEEKDAWPMPCCGRENSSNLVCGDCIATLAKRLERCPFCRKARVKSCFQAGRHQ